MKKFRILRQAKHISLDDVQKQTGIDVAVLRMFENGQLALTEEQKDALHKLFPDSKREELFGDLDLKTVHPSIFSHIKLSPRMQRIVDVEVEKSLRRIDTRIEEHRNKLIARAKEAAEKINKRSF